MRWGRWQLERTRKFTVFGGAITSLGASLMLFLCWFVPFFKFGAFMFLTILFSFLYALFFFMPLVATAGPEGSTCRFPQLHSCCEKGPR